MIRTQIQLTAEQANGLKRLAAREKKSISELVRLSVDAMIHSQGLESQDNLRGRAMAAAGLLSGPQDMAENHDNYLADVYQ